MYTVGVDLGGTKIATALVDETGRIFASTEVPTVAVDGPDAVMNRMVRSVQDVLNHVLPSDIKGVGIGAPGPLNPVNGVVYSPPNLPGWDAIPLQDEMDKRLKMQTFIENDANAAALAEATLGAGKGATNMVYITVSTGIGGGIIIDGKILHGENGSAGEIGHMVIDSNGPLCPCGNRGCLEALASGTAISHFALERFGYKMDARQVTEAAKNGDLNAKALLDDAFRWLGIGINNVIQSFDPSVIVIGGGVSFIGKPLYDALEHAVTGNRFRHSLTPVKIMPAQLGNKAGVIGASLLPWKRG